MIVCLDNHILIWGVRGEFSLGQDDMVPRTKALLADLQDRRATVIVPAPVASEYLLGVHMERHAETMATLGKYFMVAPFDAVAAPVSSQIWLERNGGRTLSPELQASAGGASRQVLNVDCQVVGIAIVRHANVIYTHDPGIRAMAGDRIKVEQVPPATKQSQLDI